MNGFEVITSSGTLFSTNESIISETNRATTQNVVAYGRWSSTRQRSLEHIGESL